MIEILVHGNKRWIGKCQNCGCVFAFSLADLYLGVIERTIIICPECGAENNEKEAKLAAKK